MNQLPHLSHHRKSLPPRTSAHRKRAFTLTELLVVIALIAVLASLRLTALAATKDKAVRLKCLHNVRQCASGVVAISIDNNNVIPVLSGGNWPVDVPFTSEATLANNGVTRDLQYDPGYPKQNSDYDFSSGFPGYSFTGYAWALNNPAPSHAVKSDDQNSSLATLATTLSAAGADDYDSQLGPPSTVVRINNSKRVLLACVTVSNKGENNPTTALNDPPTYCWGPPGGSSSTTGIQSAAPKGYATPYGPWPGYISTAHFTKRGLPEGGNEGMLDGRAAWYPFSTMRTHTTLAGN